MNEVNLKMQGAEAPATVTIYKVDSMYRPNGKRLHMVSAEAKMRAKTYVLPGYGLGFGGKVIGHDEAHRTPTEAVEDYVRRQQLAIDSAHSRISEAEQNIEAARTLLPPTEPTP